MNTHLRLGASAVPFVKLTYIPNGESKSPEWNGTCTIFKRHVDRPIDSATQALRTANFAQAWQSLTIGRLWLHIVVVLLLQARGALYTGSGAVSGREDWVPGCHAACGGDMQRASEGLGACAQSGRHCPL